VPAIFKKYRKKEDLAPEDSKAGNPRPADQGEIHPGLKGRFYGEMLFRKTRFRHLVRDFSVLNECTNRHFFSALAVHAGSNNDVSMIPALYAAAAGTGPDEALRQQASVTASELEEIKNGRVPAGRKEIQGAAEKKRFEAYLLLAGEREPSAIDMLRLLRSNDTETRRTGLYLAGKFRFREMIPEICDALDIEGLEYDALNVLGYFGEIAMAGIREKLLASTGNIKTTSLIATFAGRFPGRESNEILLNCLFSHSKPALKRAASILNDRKVFLSEGERAKVTDIAYAIASRLGFCLGAGEMIRNTGNEDLVSALNEEIHFCRSVLPDLIRLIQAGDKSVSILTGTEKGSGFADPYDIYSFRLDEILRIKEIADKLSGQRTRPGKECKKRVMPGDLTSWLINILDSDYIFSGKWLKACALRSIHGPVSDDLKLSLSALLFNPSLLISGEAALAAFRTDIRIYNSVAGRLPAGLRSYLEALKKDNHYENLVFDRVKAVKTLLPGLPAEEAMILAGKTRFVNTSEKNDLRTTSTKTEVPSQTDYLLMPVNLEGKEKTLLIPFRALEEMILTCPDRENYLLERIEEAEKTE